MPIYEYECKTCETVFEKLLLKGDPSDGMDCPQCGSKNVKKLLSAGSFLTGNGLGACAPGGTGGFS